MLKLTGALLVLAGAGGLGLSAAARLRERVSMLDGLLAALSRMNEDLAFSLPPMDELLRREACLAQGPAACFFKAVLTDKDKGFQKSWEKAVKKHLDVLKEEERRDVSELGAVLGRYDAETQRRILRQAHQRLEEYRREAREDCGRLSKVYSALSLCGGLLAVILLM